MLFNSFFCGFQPFPSLFGVAEIINPHSSLNKTNIAHTTVHRGHRAATLATMATVPQVPALCCPRQVAVQRDGADGHPTPGVVVINGLPTETTRRDVSSHRLKGRVKPCSWYFMKGFSYIIMGNISTWCVEFPVRSFWVKAWCSAFCGCSNLRETRRNFHRCPPFTNNFLLMQILRTPSKRCPQKRSKKQMVIQLLFAVEVNKTL